MADYILNMGGSKSSTLYTTVDVFQVAASGIKKVTGHDLALSEGRDSLAAASCGNYILAMGGSGSSGISRSTVDVFKVTESGVEAVTGHGLTLSQARAGLAAASCGNYILAMGGSSSGSPSNTVDVFKVTENGVEAVTGHGLSLSTARQSLAAASCGNYILAMGGSSSGSPSNTVDVFKVTESGVEKVTGHGLSLSKARYVLAAASRGNYILAMGGASGSPYNTVDVFKVTENGVEAVTGYGLALSAARYNLAAASCGNYILAMGGVSGDSSSSNTVDVFKVTESGVKAVTGHGLSLSKARYVLAAASCGNYILAMGGEDVTEYSDAVDVFQVFD